MIYFKKYLKIYNKKTIIIKKENPMKISLIIQTIALIIFTTNIFGETIYVTPKKNNPKVFKSSKGKTKTSAKLILGNIYEGSEINNNRINIPSLECWIKTRDAFYDYSKIMIQYKAKYLLTYKDDKKKEVDRRKQIVKEHPEWNKKVKKDILGGFVNRNWPESLFVASWGNPDRKLAFINKNGIKEKRLLYGQKLYIFENDSLKYEKSHFTSSLKVHLDKEDKNISKRDKNINDSTLSN